ncbi:MAG: hypothetical protein ACYC92_09700 [Candidatus Acidiferrales bacterium]
MRYLKYLVLAGVLLLGASYSQAQVSFGIGINSAYGGYVAAPDCPYGYFDYYPYACAPYGYYAPRFFVGGAFIGAGPWYGGRFDRDRYWGDRDRYDGDRYNRGFGYARGDDNRQFNRGRENGYRAYGNGYVGRGHAFGRENNRGWHGNGERRGNFNSFGRGGAHRGNSFRGGDRGRGPSGHAFQGHAFQGGRSHGGGGHRGGGGFHGGRQSHGGGRHH